MASDSDDRQEENNPKVIISDKLYYEVLEVLDEMGMDLPTAIQIYLKKIAATRSIPFKIESEQSKAIEPEKEPQHKFSSRYGIEP